MVGRAVVLGTLTGGALGLLVILGFGVFDLGEYDAGQLVAIAVIYLPMAFGFGAMTGLLHALLAVGAVFALRRLVDGRVTRAQAVATAAAALPGLVAIPLGAPFVVALPFALVSGGAAALWMPRVFGTAQ